MKKLLLVIFYFFIFNKVALALIEVDITRGNLEPLPIAVSPLFLESSSIDIKLICFTKTTYYLEWLKVKDILALEISGIKGVPLYVGSWSEWITDKTRPIAKIDK